MATSNANPQPSQSHSKPPYTIRSVRTSADLKTTISLFTAYAQSLNLDLSFQDFATEMSSMPGKYSAKFGGELLLARSSVPPVETKDSASDPDTDIGDEGKPLGCVAIRALSITNSNPTTKYCEMKRLYVTPDARGLGIGRALAEAAITRARELGYDEIRLDTLPSMGAAQRMYRDLGFVDVEAYCFNPVEGARFLGLKLTGRIRELRDRNEGDEV